MLFSSLFAALAVVATSMVTASPVQDASKIITKSGGISCGRVTCIGDQVCCNPTCSMCTAPGMMCTMQDCGHLRNTLAVSTIPVTMPKPNTTRQTPKVVTDVAPESTGGGSSLGVTCGKNTCATGEVCCNWNCGICTPPDGACIMLFCQDGKLP